MSYQVSSCVRCFNGAIVAYGPYEPPFCINCGWEPVVVPKAIADQVRGFWGKDKLDNFGPTRKIGTGKPAPSGWDREKRRRQRARGG